MNKYPETHAFARWISELFRLTWIFFLALLLFGATAEAGTVTLDFDAPDYAIGDLIPRIGDINFVPSAVIFAPNHVTSFSATQALKGTLVCASSLCPNWAYQMEIRFGSGPPPQIPNGPWIWHAADSVSVRVGADSVALSCFPEGTSCPIYARLRGWDQNGNAVADSNDVLILDSSSLSTGSYSAPITHEISIHDPFARIVRVTLVYGRDTFNHDNGFPGEPQIDHLIVNFPDGTATQIPLTRAPSVQISAPTDGSQLAYPYQVHLRGSVTTYAGIGAFCITANLPMPGESDCHDNADLQQGNTFDVPIPDGVFVSGQNTLTATVFDQTGQRAARSVTVTPATPPPPSVTLYSPSANQWLDPTHNLSVGGTIGTVGALKDLCILMDAASVPIAGNCFQDLSSIQSPNTAFQPLVFAKSIAASSVTAGQHRLSVFAFDRWDQMGRADVTFNTPTDFRVVAMEISQGVQSVAIPLNINGVAAYQGVNLRMGVPTVVRVFANTPFAGAYAGVAMFLEGFVPGPNGGESWLGGLHPDSSPPLLLSGGLSVPPSVRADPGGGYVFTLPDTWTQQNGLHLRATLTPPSGAKECAGCTFNNVFSVVGINFGAAIALKIASVALTFTDSAGNFNTPPSPSTLFAEALNLSPMPAANATVLPYAGTIDVSDLVGPVGTDGVALCRANWTSICQARIYSRMRVWESQHPQDADWMGLGNIDIGWTVSPIGIANSLEPILAVAHEFYHDLGFWHASGACGADFFIDWPPDEQGYIHGVGLDRRMNRLDASGAWTGQYTIIMAGAPGASGNGQAYDLMAYCAFMGTPWISTDNWNVFGGAFPNGLLPLSNAFGGTITSPMNGTGSATASLNEASGNGKTLEVTALLELNGSAEFLSIVPTLPKSRNLRLAVLTKDYVFVARDPRGAVLAKVEAILQYNTGHHTDTPDSRTVLSARIPDDAASVEIQLKGKVIGERRRSKSAPEVRISSVGEGLPISRAKSMDVKWTAVDKDNDALEVRIEFAAGPDAPFRPLYIGPNRGSWQVPGRILSVTDHGRVRIIANDGFNESAQIFEPLVVSAAPPAIDIVSPASGLSVPETTPIRLVAAAFGDAGTPLAAKAIQWSIDGRVIGVGVETEIKNLKPGKHVCTVVARDGIQSSEKRVGFTVRPVKSVGVSNKRSRQQ